MKETKRISKDDDVTYEINTNDNKIILKLLWGEKPNKGYKIKIKKVEITNEEIIVYYDKTYPDPQGVYNQVITYPNDSWMGDGYQLKSNYKVILKGV